MKNETQILQRFNDLNRAGVNADPSGSMRAIMLRFLPYTKIQDQLKQDVDVFAYEQSGVRLDLDKMIVESYIARIVKRGWVMANKHAALEAKRNMLRLISLLWIADDPLESYANNQKNYAQFGCPILLRVGHEYGVEIPPNLPKLKLMAQGRRCSHECKKCDNAELQ